MTTMNIRMNIRIFDLLYNSPLIARFTVGFARHYR